MHVPEDAAYHWESLAVIREEDCIGCARCLKACPVDAILGALKRMHTVIAHECTGCGLCVPACPVDCIEMRPAGIVPSPHAPRLPCGGRAQIQRAQTRAYARIRRLSARRGAAAADVASRRREILAAVSRVRTRRQPHP